MGNLKVILWLAAVIFGLFFPSLLLSQQKTESDTSSIKNTVFPIIFFLPETGLGFGGTGITTFRFNGEKPDSKPSQFIYSAAYTLKNQILIFLPFELYRNNGKERFDGEFGFYKYFYNFYGIGNNSIEEELENYDVLYPRIDFSYARSDIPNLYLGIGIKYDHYDITKVDSSGILFNTNPIGYNGGEKFNLLLTLLYDTRDNIISSSKGFFAEVKFEKSYKSFASNFEYWKYIFDLRYFVPIKERWVIASQLFGGSASSSSPFFDLPYIGTPNIARGFGDRRYMNYNVLNVQTELRFPVYRRLSGAAFISSSWVPDSITDPLSVDPRASYGMGVRYEFDKQEKTRFRFDIAYGDSLNFYLTANEAF